MTLAGRETARVSFLRNRATPYTVVEGGAVATTIRVKITNRTEEPRVYAVAVDEAPGMTSPDLPLEIDGGASGALADNGLPSVGIWQLRIVEDQVVVLKMNPVNDYLGPLLERAFEPLIRDGFLGIVTVSSQAARREGDA